MMRRFFLVVLGLMVLSTSCGDEGGGSNHKGQAECRLPSPQGEVDAGLVPDDFRPPGEITVTRTEKRKGRLVVVMTVPGTIQSVLDEYRSLTRGSGFDLLQEDNEGFEAELYLQKGRGDLAVVQIRETGCADKILVLLNLPAT